MAYVVTEPCIGCRHADCVDVCPVECFHFDEQRNMLLIDDICIDCGCCVPVCPVEAIYTDLDVPEKWQEWITINAEESINFPMVDSQEEAELAQKGEHCS